MKRARAKAMPRQPVIAHAIADKDVATWYLLQHEGEIFCPHRRLDRVVDVFIADDRTHDFCCKGGFFRMVDGRRIGAVKFKICLATQSNGRVFGNFFNPLFD